MATLYEYALIADAVYGSDDDENASQKKLRRRGWSCPPSLAVYDQSVLSSVWAYATGGVVHGSLISSGFQGRAFVKGTEAVAAYKGTRPTQTSDITADVRLAFGYVPTQAKDALKCTVDWANHLRGKTMTLVGHSLGGAIAQYVGHHTGYDFVTFNAPGMRDNVQGLSSSQTRGRRGRAAQGLNLRSSGWFSPIAGLGTHIGRVEVLEGAAKGHSITVFIDYLRSGPDHSRRPF